MAHGAMDTGREAFTRNGGLVDFQRAEALAAQNAALAVALREIVGAAEEQGWDVVPDLAPVLNAARDALAKAEG